MTLTLSPGFNVIMFLFTESTDVRHCFHIRIGSRRAGSDASFLCPDLPLDVTLIAEWLARTVSLPTQAGLPTLKLIIADPLCLAH